jgi:hypothetical protein
MPEETKAGNLVATVAGTPARNYRVEIGKIDAIPPEMLRPAPDAEVGDEFWKGIALYFAGLLERPDFRERAVTALKKVIPGTVLDWLAPRLYDVAARAIIDALSDDKPN